MPTCKTKNPCASSSSSGLEHCRAGVTLLPGVDSAEKSLHFSMLLIWCNSGVMGTETLQKFPNGEEGDVSVFLRAGSAVASVVISWARCKVHKLLS